MLHSEQIRKEWWRGMDSNHRRQSRQIYSLIPLTAREPLHLVSGFLRINLLFNVLANFLLALRQKASAILLMGIYLGKRFLQIFYKFFVYPSKNRINKRKMQ